MSGLEGQLYDPWQENKNIKCSSGECEIKIEDDPDFNFINPSK